MEPDASPTDDSYAVAPGRERAGLAVRRRRGLLLVGLVGALILAVVLAGLWSADHPSTTRSSRPSRAAGLAPAFRLPDLRDSSGQVSLDDFRGRPLVVNF